VNVWCLSRKTMIRSQGAALQSTNSLCIDPVLTSHSALRCHVSLSIVPLFLPSHMQLAFTAIAVFIIVCLFCVSGVCDRFLTLVCIEALRLTCLLF